VSTLHPGDIDRLAVESRRRHGLPDYVEDPATIARVVRLIMAGVQEDAADRMPRLAPGDHRPDYWEAIGQRDEHSQLIGKASHAAVGEVQHHSKREQHRQPGKERGPA
jgi:hypothetical protein